MPSSVIPPALGSSRPTTRLTVVLLPDPFGPRYPTISPGFTVEADPIQGQQSAVALGESRPAAWLPALTVRVRHRRTVAFCTTLH